MNSLFGRSRIVASALCGIALAACNAVQDVNEEPTIAGPQQQAVLQGTIAGLGTRRPITLQNNGQDTCIQPKDPNNPSSDQIVGECKFFGVLNRPTSAFSFGSLPVGSPYNITIKKAPFAKKCTVTSGGTGTVGAVNAAPIQITCTDDPAVPHYSVTVGIAAAASSKPGLKLVLTTENGSWEVPATGLTSYTFSYPNGYVFDSQFGIPASQPNLPVFGWRVTATIPGATAIDPVNNCFVTGGPVANTGGNIGDDGKATAAPTGNVSGVQVASCGFQIRAQSEYSAATGQATPAIATGDGITLLLRQQPSGVDVAGVKVTSFNNTFVPFADLDAQGNPTATAHEVPSNVNAFYEVVVKSSPAGMACVPGFSGSRAIGASTDGGAVLLIQPASARVAGSWIVDRVVRCRLIPAVTANRLRGVYQQTVTTTTKTTVGTAAPVTTSSTVTNRNFLALFEDGTYLFGAHVSSATSSGTEQGFYDYNSTTGAITFTAFTDTSGAGGLHNAGAATSLSALVKSTGGSPKTITAHSTTTTTTGLVLGSGTLTVAVNSAAAVNVAAATYATPATLATAINTAAGSTIAVVSGSEIQITGPTGGVVIAGSAATNLGFVSVAAGATAISTGVAKATSTIVQVDGDWRLTELGPDLSDLSHSTLVDGAWVTWDKNQLVEDRRRVFIYAHGRYQAVHIGVNGIPNMQDACYVGNIAVTGTSSGEWVRQGARSGCTLTINTVTSAGATSSSALASLDLPNPTTGSTLILTPGFQGKWPQSTDPSFTDGRPYSPVEFEFRAAGTVPGDTVCPNLDKLTVWDTVNGTRVDQLTPPIPPIVLCRVTVN